MEIIKSKRKGSVCKRCWKKINGKYKVEIKRGWEKTTSEYYHLSCYSNRLKLQLDVLKKRLKKFSKTKYKKQIILEKL